MADFGSIMSTVTSGGATTFKWIAIIIGVVLVVSIILSLIIWWRFSKSKYNLRVEVKIPRSDGQIILAEWAKGGFNAKRGVVYIKRDKMAAVAMKVIDIRRYLQGNDLLTVIQVGPEDYRPVLNDSWTSHIVEYEDEKGNIEQIKESILNIKIDTGEYKAWKSAWDSAAKRAYSLSSFLTQFATPIAIAIVLIACFIGFAILWSKLGSICGA
jgi:hypothetical protein